MDEQNRCINKVWIEVDTHDAILYEANVQGVTVAQYAAKLLNEKVKEKGFNTESDDPAIRSYWNWFKVKEKQRAIDRVHRTASMYCDTPTEDMADLLKQMCEDAGMDYKDIVIRAQNDPFSSIVSESRNGTKQGRCMKWLSKVMQQQGGRVPVSTLHTMASIEGYKPSMLNRVKSAINNDSDVPIILSERESDGWVWVLTEEQLQEG